MGSRVAVCFVRHVIAAKIKSPKMIDVESNAAQSSSRSSPMSFGFGSRYCAELRRPQEKIDSRVLMHFSFYLMMAALVLVGLEVAYALYQLAAFVL
jgi:hypothetical protein